MQVRSVSLQSDIATYWPGMHKTVALVVFAFLFDGYRFDYIVV